MAARRFSKSAASTGNNPQNTTGIAGRNPGSGCRHRPLVVGNGVADAGIGHFLDRGGEEADLAGTEFVALDALGREHADAIDLIGGVGAHHADALAFLQHAVDDAEQHDDAQIGIVPAVDEERFQRCRRIALGRRQPLHDRFQHRGHVLPGLGRDQDRVGGIQPDHVLDLLLDLVGLGGRQIDLVEHRDDLMVVVERLVDIGQRLRLHPLAGVDDQQRAFAGGKRAVDLVGEVDMAGGVDEVEHVILAVARPVIEPHGLRLDGDAALALDVHGIEHLLDHFARFEPAGELNQPVRERRFAVVDMGDDSEVADVLDWDRRHGGEITPATGAFKPTSGRRLMDEQMPACDRGAAMQGRHIHEINQSRGQREDGVEAVIPNLSWRYSGGTATNQAIALSTVRSGGRS